MDISRQQRCMLIERAALTYMSHCYLGVKMTTGRSRGTLIGATRKLNTPIFLSFQLNTMIGVKCMQQGLVRCPH